MDRQRSPVKKVAVFTGHYLPHMGGVEQYTAALWGRLARRGYSVLIVTGNTNNVAEREVLDGVEVLRFPVFNVVNGRIPIIKPAPGLVRCLKALWRWHPDMVVTNTRFFPVCVIGRFFAGLMGIPHFHIEHGSEHINLGNRFFSKAGEAWDHLFGSYVVRNADKCFGVSKSIGAMLGHLGSDCPGVMYNGVDTSSFFPGPSSLRKKLGVGERSFLFLFAARLIEDKGVKVLLDAFNEIPAGADCALAIAGSGHLEDMVRKAASKNGRIHFVGRLGREDMIDFLRAGDCFVLPTNYPEGLPTSILEALAVGLPVITTPKGGNREAVQDGWDGLIVQPEDEGMLMEAMLGLARDPERARGMGVNARKCAVEEFDWEGITDRMAMELEFLDRGNRDE